MPSRAAIVMVILLALLGHVRADGSSSILVDDAQKLYNLGRYGEAAETFRRAYEIDPRPRLLFAIAQAERLSGDCPRAIADYDSFLATHPPKEQAHVATQWRQRCADEPVRPPAQPIVEPTAAPLTAVPVAAPVPAPRPELVVVVPPRKPVWKRAWFWGVIGSSVAVSVAVVTTAVVLTRRELPPELPPTTLPH